MLYPVMKICSRYLRSARCSRTVRRKLSFPAASVAAMSASSSFMSMVYQLSRNQEALQRPSKLVVNYRSHSGILNCAAAVLWRMLAMFPGAAKTLPSDEGLFSGPRPAFLQTEGLDDVHRMLGMNELFVVLCADSAVSRVQSGLRCGDGSAAAVLSAQFILSIRAAKGLEFADVIIPDTDYRAWKELLDADSGGLAGGGQCCLSAYAHPQLEPQLKLLYTAISRCINRLVFVETAKSRVGGVFFRWLQRRELAERCTMLDGADATGAEAAGQGAGLVLMTTDEWKARGIDLALAATSVACAESAGVAGMFEQAAYCFQRANSSALRSCAVLSAQMAEARASLQGAESLLGRELGAVEEVQLAGLIARCLRAGLRREVRELCKLVASVLPVRSLAYFAPEVLAKF